jgi:hypothetical protein
MSNIGMHDIHPLFERHFFLGSKYRSAPDLHSVMAVTESCFPGGIMPQRSMVAA